MLCWSASFYPQPIYNYQRGSTSGLAIDFPTINFLGFSYYAIYTSAFLYSPVIRQQYAARFPNSGEPTVRFNDLAFAVHAVVLSAIVYSQFWPSIWGLRVLRTQRISKTMLGLFWGSVMAPLVIVWMVVARSPDGGLDPASWAWIDVVSLYIDMSTGLVSSSLTGRYLSRFMHCRMSSSSSRW
jgi:cystinosin